MMEREILFCGKSWDNGEWYTDATCCPDYYAPLPESPTAELTLPTAKEGGFSVQIPMPKGRGFTPRLVILSIGGIGLNNG